MFDTLKLNCSFMRHAETAELTLIKFGVYTKSYRTNSILISIS